MISTVKGTGQDLALLPLRDNGRQTTNRDAERAEVYCASEAGSGGRGAREPFASAR
jgi:hypothetical protein